LKSGIFKIYQQFFLIAFFVSVSFADLYLDVYSSENINDAKAYTKDLIRLNYKAFIHIHERHPDNEVLYKVRLGPFKDGQEVQEQKKKLLFNSFEGDMLVVETKRPKSDVDEAVKKKLVKLMQLRKNEIPVLEQVQPETEQQSSPAEKTRSATLEWDVNREPDLGGYNIYYDTKSGSPYTPDQKDYADEGPPPIKVDKDKTKITLNGLSESKEYYFSVTAFNTDKGTESGFSNEVYLPLKDIGDGDPAGQDSAQQGVFDQAQTEMQQGDTLQAEIPISAGDSIYIEVPGQKEMSMVYDVDPDGHVYIMSVGQVNVKGLDLPGLEKLITQKVQKFIVKGDKLKFRLAARQRYINITGGVRYPGWYRVDYLTTLNKLIEVAGGLLSKKAYNKIKIERDTRDGIINISVKGRIKLLANDHLVIPTPKVFRKKVDTGDLLFIEVPGKEEEKGDSQSKTEVDSNGYMYVADFGHIYVNGLTTTEIIEILKSKLPKYLARSSKIQVSIMEKKHYVHVMGHVTNPGRYNIPETGNVQSAFSAAGGAVDGAILSGAKIQRKTKSGIINMSVNMYQYIITGDIRLLTPLHQNDTLFIPISASFGNVKRTLRSWDPPKEQLEEDKGNKVRIFGAVQDPGIYEPKEDMDLLDLIILGSGTTDDADLSRVQIIRNNKVEQIFNLFAFLNEEPDAGEIPKITNGDTIYVKYFEKTTFEPAEDKVYYVLGKGCADPGQYKLYDNMTIFQALARADGFNGSADLRNMLILRLVNGRQDNIHLDLTRAILGKVPEINVMILPNDTIYIPIR